MASTAKHIRRIRKKVFPQRIANYQFTANIEYDSESGFYVANVPNLSGAHTQAATLDELNHNLKEVIELCMEELSDEELNHLPIFIGVQQFSIKR